MILKIDTKDQKIIRVSLFKEDEKLEEMSDENQFGSQVLLGLIQKILKNNKLEFSDLKGIEVKTGPGSYTGLKVGVSVANALGFSLGIPVNSKNKEIEINY